jgi:hypothetical protein
VLQVGEQSGRQRENFFLLILVSEPPWAGGNRPGFQVGPDQNRNLALAEPKLRHQAVGQGVVAAFLGHLRLNRERQSLLLVRAVFAPAILVRATFGTQSPPLFFA